MAPGKARWGAYVTSINKTVIGITEGNRLTIGSGIGTPQENQIDLGIANAKYIDDFIANLERLKSICD